MSTLQAQLQQRIQHGPLLLEISANTRPHADIALLRACMNELGYSDVAPRLDTVSPLVILELRHLQGELGVKVDGDCGPLTWAALAKQWPLRGKPTVPVAPAQRATSTAGRTLIAEFEGRRKAVYKDPAPAANPTVGVGHLLSPAEREKWPVGTILSNQTIDNLFTQDLAEAEAGVLKLVKVPLTDNQFAALVSFVFNLGAGNLKKSTLLSKLNASDYKGAAAQFAVWDKAGGHVLPGLTRRRAAEKALFLKP